MTIAHADLVFAGHQWLRFSTRPRHYVVMSECASAVSETPDVIGWTGGFSTLIECKTSRSDFMADRQKAFRRDPAQGMGYHRWFLTPPGLLRPDELPEKWGLAELRGERVYKMKKPEPFFERNMRNEMHLLVSAVRRIEVQKGLQVFSPPLEKPISVHNGHVRLTPYLSTAVSV